MKKPRTSLQLEVAGVAVVVAEDAVDETKRVMIATATQVTKTHLIVLPRLMTTTKMITKSKKFDVDSVLATEAVIAMRTSERVTPKIAAEDVDAQTNLTRQIEALETDKIETQNLRVNLAAGAPRFHLGSKPWISW